MPIFDQYKEKGELPSQEIIPPNQEELEYFAKVSFSGTQLHYYTDLEQLSNRCETLGRIPTFDDLRDTFPTTKLNESRAIEVLFTKFGNPVDVWKQWILNSEVPKNKNCGIILPPEIIKGIWDSGIYNPDIEKITNNIETEKIVMHEVCTILNLKLKKRNLQIPSYIDTVILEPINGSRKNKKITIIDYKTGNKDLFKITFLDRLQAFLMSTSVFYSFIDIKVSSGFSDWDVTHPLKNMALSHLDRRAMLGPLTFNKSITDYELLFHLDNIQDSVKFILNNPITNKSVEVNYAPVAKKILEYLSNLNEFYSQNKNRLKSPKVKGYITPRFVPERILDYEKYIENSQYAGTQMAFI